MKLVIGMLSAILSFTPMLFATERDAGVLLRADRDFAQAVAAKGLDGWMAYMAPNAVLLHAEPLVGLEQIRAGMAKSFNSPGFQLTWKPAKAEFVGKGPVGYTVGRYESKSTDANGKPQVSHGSYLTTWHKQPDGTWKVISDIGSPDPQ